MVQKRHKIPFDELDQTVFEEMRVCMSAMILYDDKGTKNYGVIKRCDCMKGLNQILNVMIGVFLGVFIGYGMYKFWDFNYHADLYAMQSAPWYTGIILQGLITGIVVAIAIVIKWIIKKYY